MNKNNLYVVQQEMIIKEKDESVKTLLQNNILAYETSGKKINSLVKIESETEELFLNALMKRRRKSILILRYSDLNCHSCIDNQISIMKDMSKLIGRENILILATYKYERDFYLFKKMSKLNGIMIYNTKNIDMPLDNYGKPYVFVLDLNMVISSIFIPHNDYDELTKSYYKYLISNYFK